jgi:hypothetical protein
MGKTYAEIDDRLRSFISRQHMFFVASAPTGPDGHVNCSPKGLDTFRILAPTRVAYLDFVGSGVETIAHLRQNGRVVLMFCAFEGPPNIVRLHGRGAVVEPRDPEFDSLLTSFDTRPGIRAIVRVDLTRISDSCGYGVPLLRFEADRPQMGEWAERKGESGLEKYQRENNAASLDDLPGLRWTRPRATSAAPPSAALVEQRKTRAAGDRAGPRDGMRVAKLDFRSRIATRRRSSPRERRPSVPNTRALEARQRDARGMSAVTTTSPARTLSAIQSSAASGSPATTTMSTRSRAGTWSFVLATSVTATP